MALIKCPECGKDTSDQALDCPNCGYPIMRQYCYMIWKNTTKLLNYFLKSQILKTPQPI